MKDNFSHVASEYATFRPTYPEELYEFIYSQFSNFDAAWDCGTGSGQVAGVLSRKFSRVDATDISEKQLAAAVKQPNIHYTQQPAEATNFPSQHFDLITVAQAIHWFDFEKFYAEVKRTLKPDGLLVVMGYGLLSISPEIDQLMAHFYNVTIGPYWDPERRYLDEAYQTIPFPFREISTPAFYAELEWSLDHFFGYLGTWSAVKHYKTSHHSDPLPELRKALTPLWPEKRIVSFSILTRIGFNT